MVESDIKSAKKVGYTSLESSKNKPEASLGKQ
jgi:hypothetical protein